MSTICCMDLSHDAMMRWNSMADVKPDEHVWAADNILKICQLFIKTTMAACVIINDMC